MTAAISANPHPLALPKPYPAGPAPSPTPVKQAPQPATPATTPAVDDEEIEHPFADIDPQYEGETILKSEAEKVWDDDQSKDLFGKDGFTFDDFLDIINPLQHIPVVSTIYRAITDDQIDPGARLAGGALYGGGLGFAGALFNAVIENDTGKDIGEHALALVGIGDDNEAPADIAAQAVGQAANDKTSTAQPANPNQAGGNPVAEAAVTQKSVRNQPFPGAPVVPVQSQRGRAFGGIMIPPTGTPPAATGQIAPKTPQSKAVDALLQARTAVPGRNAQPIAGAGGRSRFTGGAGPKPDAAQASPPIVNPKDPISLSPTMAAKLSALSRKTKSASTAQTQQDPRASTTAQPATPKREAQSPNSTLGTGNFQNAAAPLPNLMLDALDKYELMVRERQKKRT